MGRIFFFILIVVLPFLAPSHGQGEEVRGPIWTAIIALEQDREQIWEVLNEHQGHLESLLQAVGSIKKELGEVRGIIDEQQQQIEILKDEIRYIRKWTFLGEPSFEVEQE